MNEGVDRTRARISEREREEVKSVTVKKEQVGKGENGKKERDEAA